MPYDLSPRIYSDEYYIALGKFVSEFSELEQTLQLSLWKLSKVKEPLAQAVFSGVRADDAANKINRIGVAEKWSEEKRAEWKAISDRIGIIRSLGNDILHYGVLWEKEGWWVSTNKMFVHTPDKITRTPVSIRILTAATDDIQSLYFALFDFLFMDGMTKRTSILSAVDRTLADTWGYKPPPQGGRQDRSAGKSPKSKRRPPA